MENTKNDVVEEPMTPAGRLFFTTEMNQIISCAIGLKNPIDINAMKSELETSALVNQPRFSSLLVRGHWRRTHVNIDRHVIIRDGPLAVDPSVSSEDAVNDYLADLAVSSPLSLDKPLWEFHFLMAHNCVVLRFHHALGDGISVMSALLLSCRRADDPTRTPTITSSSGGRRQRRSWSFWKLLKSVWYTIVFVTDLVLRMFWLKDEKTAISGGAGVELWPRKLATAKFNLHDMKLVKKAVAGATLNDVLCGIISSGLSKYLAVRSPPESEALKEGLRMTGVCFVNLRPLPGLQELSTLADKKSGSRFGNQISIWLFPVYCHKNNSGSDPLQFVRRVKQIMDKKKLSLAGPWSYKLWHLVMSIIGPKWAAWLGYSLGCHTSFTISNVVGPAEEIEILGNPVTYIRLNASSAAQALIMHMVSYGARADLQILVAKDIIPDPQFLANCFEDALIQMKDFAVAHFGDNNIPQVEKKYWLFSKLMAGPVHVG